MSALSDRLSEDDLRELARLVRGIHTRAAAKRERERLARQQGGEPATPAESAQNGGGEVA